MVAGRAVDEAGEPVPGAVATAWSYGLGFPADRDGRFRITGLGEGRCVLRVAAPGFLTKRVLVPAGADEVSAVLSRGVVLRVAVRDRFGDPVSRARVAIEREATT